MKNYLKRIADEIIDNELAAIGALHIVGPKWCGKSTTAMRHANSVVMMQDPDTRIQNIDLAKTKPSRLLQGDVPRLIDEWQTVPSLWDAVRGMIDKRGEMGQFILTGSVVPPDEGEMLHSGTGRFVQYRMRPLSLWESLESNGQVSLRTLFSGEIDIDGECNLELEDYAFLSCRGGWPQAVSLPKSASLKIVGNLFSMLVEKDIVRVDKVKRSPERARTLLSSYARITATQANNATIRKDMEANDDKSLTDPTVASYLDALNRLFVIEDLDAWHPVMLRRQTIRTTRTRHFTDPSFACAALNASPDDLLNNLRSFGVIFESLVIRDLRTYAEPIGGNVYHFKDRYGLEADAVIHLPNGAYGLVEVKLLSQENIDEGARNLLDIQNQLDPKHMKKPSFLAIITCGKYAYRRADGVYVIPLGCLRD